VFEYSDVDNASSFVLDAKVDPKSLPTAANALMALQKKISRERLRAWKGRTEIALLEGRPRTIHWCGKRGCKAWRQKSTANSI